MANKWSVERVLRCARYLDGILAVVSAGVAIYYLVTAHWLAASFWSVSAVISVVCCYLQPARWFIRRHILS